MGARCATRRAPSTVTAEGHPFLSGIILAAGSATRMGRPKQLLPLRGRCLLQHVIDAAAGSCLDEILVILGDHAEEIQTVLQLPRGRAVRIVVAAEYAEGQSSSLRAGLRACDAQSRAAGVLLGDQPGVSSAIIDRVAACCLAADRPIVRPVYSGAGGRTPGHPVFLARRLWPEVVTLRGDQGARALISAHPEWLLEIVIDAVAPADIDTAEDYRRVCEAKPTSKDRQI